MPLEFSVAGFRFGPTMVRAAYAYNRNWGRPAVGQRQPPLQPHASFDQIFLFAGEG